MDFKVTKTLEVKNNEGDYLELENYDLVTIWIKDGSCMAVQIQEIKDSGIAIRNKNKEEVFITFDEIENIQEN